MGSFILLALILPLIAGHAGATGLKRSPQQLNFPEPRRLSAAVSFSKLNARGLPDTLFAREASFDYLWDDRHGEQSVFTTTVDVESQWPIVALENMDPDLDDVICTESQIQLPFRSTKAFDALRTELLSMTEFVVVTSHEGCDSEGERSLRRVTGATVELDRKLITLETEKIDWHDAFSSTKVAFSRRHPTDIKKRAANPFKREQQAPASTQSFPPAPSDTSNLGSTADISFNKQYTDYPIYPPENAVLAAALPQLPIEITCNDCTIRGEIELAKGAFSVDDDENLRSTRDLSEVVDNFDGAIDFFQHGSVDISLKQFFSTIDLGFKLSADNLQAPLSLPLPNIALTPFQIPGVVTFGPMIQPQVVVGFSTDADIGFSTGFNVTAPDNSRIHINMSEPLSSRIVGLDETTFHTLPFETTAEATSMELSIALRPTILLGISAGFKSSKFNLNGGIGAFVGLPKLSLNVTHLNDVNEQCEPVAHDDEGAGNATSIIPSVELNMGVLAVFEVQILEYGTDQNTETVLTSTSTNLPTVCVLFDAYSPTPLGSDNIDGGGGSSAPRLTHEGGITLLCAALISAITVTFCGWC